MKHFLLLGAYRDNEVSPSHPLMLALESLPQGGASIESVVLGPLKQADVLRLTADTFHCDKGHVEPLARLLYEKTRGNPFFTIQFLTTLADEGLVRFDGNQAGWQWDLSRIRTKGFTDNVVDLMVGRLKWLPLEARECLKRLACLGNKARLSTLALSLETTCEAIESDLRESIRVGLVLHQGEDILFLHDRGQEAAYALIPQRDRPSAHLRIGRRLLAQAGRDGLDENLFDVANHLNRGIGLITDSPEKAQLAELNVAAGKRARASIAYATACDFFASAADLLTEQARRSRYGLLLELYLNWAEAAYLRGTFEEAEHLFVEPDAELFATAGTDRQIKLKHASKQSLRGVAQSILNYVKRTGRPVFIADAAADAGDFADDEHLLRTRPKSVLCLPILRQAKLFGVVYLENNLVAGAFTPDRRAVLEALAGQAAISLDNALLYADLERKVAERTRALQSANQQLEKLAITDALTGLPNRRYLTETFDMEWRRAVRAGTTIAVAMIDIDEFKAYNDHYGHLAGDECLLKVASVLRQNVREGDLVSRYGGEEFVVVLPNTDPDLAFEIAERIRAAVTTAAGLFI